jgi:hypothetical protein
MPPHEMGKVLLYTSRGSDTEPMSLTHSVEEDLPAVLKSIAELYSPIRSEQSSFYHVHELTIFLEHNRHIYVREDNSWAMKGRYDNALKRPEKLPWRKNAEGKLSVSLLAVSGFPLSLFICLILFQGN